MLYTILKGLLFSALSSFLFSLNAGATQDRPANPFSYAPLSKDHQLALLNTLSRAAPAANPKVIGLALSALDCALTQGMSPARNLTVIDYSLVSTQPRLWVFDLVTGKLLFQELVAHGMNTGKNFARNFSNTYGSRQTSLGLFRTKETYVGANGYSLRMEGLEDGFNDKAMERAIVFKVIDTIKGEQFLFSYYPDQQWLSKSQFLNCPSSQRWAKK